MNWSWLWPFRPKPPAPRPPVSPLVPPVPPRPIPPPRPVLLDGPAAALFALHNAERSRRGLPALVVNAPLTAAATVQARDIAGRNGRGELHVGSDGSDVETRVNRQVYAWLGLAENVASGKTGYVIEPAETMLKWMGSPGHRVNILGKYRDVGIGVETAASGTGYAVVVFGMPR